LTVGGALSDGLGVAFLTGSARKGGRAKSNQLFSKLMHHCLTRFLDPVSRIIDEKYSSKCTT